MKTANVSRDVANLWFGCKHLRFAVVNQVTENDLVSPSNILSLHKSLSLALDAADEDKGVVIELGAFRGKSCLAMVHEG